MPTAAVGGEGSLAPAQLFAAYYEHRNQTPPPKELQQLFDQLHEEAAEVKAERVLPGVAK